MYTEIMLQGKAQNFFVIPRDALHENEIFIVNKNAQLERRTIEKAQVQGKMVLLTQGLKEGEMLIVSDVFPAITGMQVKIIAQPELQKNIENWAQEQ